jgi:hypothetical protein
VDSKVETLASSDTSVETTLETDVTDDRTAEFDVPSDVPADVIAEVETAPLMRTTELRNVDVCVEASVARLATVDTPLDVLVSAERLLEICVWRPTT